MSRPEWQQLRVAVEEAVSLRRQKLESSRLVELMSKVPDMVAVQELAERLAKRNVALCGAEALEKAEEAIQSMVHHVLVQDSDSLNLDHARKLLDCSCRLHEALDDRAAPGNTRLLQLLLQMTDVHELHKQASISSDRDCSLDNESLPSWEVLQ